MSDTSEKSEKMSIAPDEKPDSPDNAEKMSIVPENAEKMSIVPEENAEKTSTPPDKGEKMSIVPENAEKMSIVPENAEKQSIVPEDAEKKSIIPDKAENAEKMSIVPDKAEKMSIVPEKVEKKPEKAESKTTSPEKTDVCGGFPEKPEKKKSISSPKKLSSEALPPGSPQEDKGPLEPHEKEESKNERLSRQSQLVPIEDISEEPKEFKEPYIKKCKSLDSPLGPKVQVGAGDEEILIEDDDTFPQPRKPKDCCIPDWATPKISHKKYLMINPGDIEYRPAAMTQFPLIVRQISREAHSELLKHSCQRLLPEKLKVPDSSKDQSMSSVRKHYHKRQSHLKVPHESMERKLKRLKIYRRAFGSLVLYFRAYSPLLFHIKKAYEDVLRYRLRQFREAQTEKMRIFQEKVATEVKMSAYKFPDHLRLRKAEQYLNLLFVRIRKQDEAIQCMTDILSKMERSLSDHYEKYRDMEDQIKLLDHDLNELTTRSMLSSKKLEIPPDTGDEGELEDDLLGGGGAGLAFLEEEAAGETIDESEEFDEDKRVVLILAYAVCKQELDDARKKLKLYEKKFEIQRQKKRLRQGFLPGDEEEGEEGEEGDEWAKMMEAALADKDHLSGKLGDGEEGDGEEGEDGDEELEDDLFGGDEDKGGEDDDKAEEEEEDKKRKGSDDLDDDDLMKLIDSDEKLDKKSIADKKSVALDDSLDDKPDKKSLALDKKSVALDDSLDDKPDKKSVALDDTLDD